MSKYKVVPVDLTKEMLDSDPYGMGYGRIQAVYHQLLSASPETGRVAVPRELLESAVTWLEVHSSSPGSAEWSVADDLRTILEEGK